jgi:hypothetical protein
MMSTRSRIAVKRLDGTFRSIYCHCIGYPSGVGESLSTHYTEPGKVEQLIDLGDISSLGPEIGEPYPFGDRSDATSGWCRAYGRDRHKTGVEAETSLDFRALVVLTDGCGGEYLYVFDDGVWRCFDASGMVSGQSRPRPDR